MFTLKNFKTIKHTFIPVYSNRNSGYKSFRHTVQVENAVTGTMHTGVGSSENSAERDALSKHFPNNDFAKLILSQTYAK